MYTVKQVAELAQISVRTLHYYDEIGLLHPAEVGANSYRYYDDAALLRLQQILLYREIGLELMQIKDILDSPDFDLVTALHAHRETLQQKIGRLHELITTVDSTIEHVSGGRDMSKKKLFTGFTPEEQKENERLARLQYGPDLVNESVKRWNGYGKARQEDILRENGQVYTELAAALEAGQSASSPEVQELMQRWHDGIRYFYEPTLEILRGLGDLYQTPEFAANIGQFHADLPAYMREAITVYVDELEYAEIERMLAEDEAKKAGN